MGNALDKITIKGFKSIKSLEDFELKNLNILIGGNGAGKSNFVEVFRMLRAMVEENFANFISERGWADDFLFNGPKQTKTIEMKFQFGDNSYSFELTPATTGIFIIKNEKEGYCNNFTTIGSGNRESKISSMKDEKSARFPNYHGVGYYNYDAISSWIVYHFHDTSAVSPMRRLEITADNPRLRHNGANIAPFLLNLRECRDGKECIFYRSGDSYTKLTGHNSYDQIIAAIRLVTPFFDTFILQPEQKGEKEKVHLSWKQKGSDYPMQPYHFSDGTIRFICLATALLQPVPPSTIVIDEPELGLHPYAIEILAELIQAAAQKTQVIISTQSPHLIDKFKPDDVIIVNREDGASTFKRLDEKELSNWLKEYSLGELWRKNVIAGGPVNE